MKINFEVEGKSVYEIMTTTEGKTIRIKVRNCHTPEEAKAVANYYRIRRE